MTSPLDLVGQRLRDARHAANLTLDELSTRARISPSTLSRLESGKRQATLDLLVPLTGVLGISLDDLVRQQNTDPRVQRPVIKKDGHIIAPLTREQSPVQSYKITYPPRTELPELRTHEGYEWLYVLSGRLRLRVGDSELVLTSGEAAQFDTRLPHAMSADGSRPAQVISMFNEAGDQMHVHALGDHEG
ncbi:MAG: helix-turn-helix domain-containing protein [Mycetocola sp.]